jgi:hypothetical protein
MGQSGKTPLLRTELGLIAVVATTALFLLFGRT